VDAPKGQPENPMSSEEVRAKALDLMGPVLGDARSDAVASQIQNLESLTNSRELGPLLRKTAK